MRHNVYGRHLSRTKNERTALFKNLIQSLFLHDQIKTSEAKAKAIKGLVDKIINQAKKSKDKQSFLADRLKISEFVIKKEATEKLYSNLSSRFKGRTSGYTRMVKLGRRQGDNSMQVVLSLVEEVKSHSAKASRDKKDEESK